MIFIAPMAYVLKQKHFTLECVNTRFGHFYNDYIIFSKNYHDDLKYTEFNYYVCNIKNLERYSCANR